MEIIEIKIVPFIKSTPPLACRVGRRRCCMTCPPYRRDGTLPCHLKTGLLHSAPTECLHYQNRLDRGTATTGHKRTRGEVRIDYDDF